MTSAQAHQRMKIKLRRVLISAGLEGMSQRDLTSKCRTYNPKSNRNGATVADVVDVLNDWRVRKWVQVFSVTKGYSKKPTRVWRATTDLKNARI